MGHLQGEVRCEDITDPLWHDGGRRTHFFCGIGGWELALNMAGWPADRPVWTGSCPCQPFSSAGKRRGTDDERHLWPAFFSLIAEHRPATVFGEQVAGRAGLEWLARVRADLEGIGYAVGAADLCAACVGAPHIRQRLFWVADAQGTATRSSHNVRRRQPDARAVCRKCDGLADAQRGAAERHGPELASSARGVPGKAREQRFRPDAGDGVADGPRLGDAVEPRPQGHAGHGDIGDQPGWVAQAQGRSAPEAGVGLVRCLEPTRDGGTVEKWRRAPLEPGLQPLAHGLPNRVGILRGAGNAIVPQVAAAFVRAFMDARGAV
jgi:DNA (cytosine-5)-methyltransferase 1